MDEGERKAIPGALYYRGIDVKEIVKADKREHRYGYEETRRESAEDGCDFYHRCPFATEQCKKRPELTDAFEKTGASGEGLEHLVRCWNPVRQDT